MTNEITLSDLSEKLDTLIRIQAALAVKDEQSQKDKIVFLYGAGLAPKEISEIIGTTPNTVSVAISTHKKQTAKKTKAKKNG